MFTIRNSNQGTQTTAKTAGQVKRILRNIAKQYGQAALKGIYVDDPTGGVWYAEDLVK